MKKRDNTAGILSAKMLTALMCGLLLFGSCSDDFLKPDPLSFYEPTTTFSTESGLQAAMANCDKNLRNNWTHYSANSNSAPIATEYVYSDLSVATKADVGSNILSNIDVQLNPTQEDLGHEGGDFRLFYWEEGFKGIKAANTILTFIDAVEGLDEATKNAYKGRAYFHRAYRYYNLVFQFGDVPLITKIPEVPKFTYRSATKATILDMMTADMEFAVQWVPDQKDMTYVGMVNKGACRMLLIKCYLATGQFQKAKDQADILIDQSGYELMRESFGSFIQNYSPETWKVERNVVWDLHRAENKLIEANKEVIMGMPNRGSTSESMIPFFTMRVFGPMWNNTNIKTPDGMNAVTNWARNNANYSAHLDYTRAIGRGIGCYTLTDFAQNDLWKVNGQADDGDLRHNSTVGNWGRMDSIKCNNKESEWYGKNLRLEDGFTLDSSSTNNANQIWYDWPHYKLYMHDVTAEANPGQPQFSGATNGGNADWYLYRLAEAYLLRAEAKFYLGDAAGAAGDVNEVRKRAKCTQLYPTVGIDDIADERARELYLEEWRNVELTRISRSLALAGKPDRFGNFTPNDADRLSEIESFWYHRLTKYGYYNKGVQIRDKTYSVAKHNIYWPVPNSAITANKKGKLSQNYGYDGYDANTPKWNNWQDAVADEDRIE